LPLTAPPPLTTTRLLLRRVEERDIADLLGVNGDDEVTRFLPYASWQGLADGQAWLARMRSREAAGDTLQFAILSQDTGRAIGSCLIFHHDEGSARAEIGYVLGRDHWRQGLAREALQSLVGWAMGPAGLRRLEAEINPINQASARLLLSLGFQAEGLLRERWLNKGQVTDSQLYGLLHRDHKPQGLDAAA